MRSGIAPWSRCFWFARGGKILRRRWPRARWRARSASAPQVSRFVAIALTLAVAHIGSAQQTIAIDERLAAAAHLHVGDRVVLAAEPGGVRGDTFVVAAITRRGADPSEVARNAYRVRLHLGELQRRLGAGDKVSRFAVASTNAPRTLAAINDVAFGFRAYPSADIAVRTSKTFRVLRRFHWAI